MTTCRPSSVVSAPSLAGFFVAGLFGLACGGAAHAFGPPAGEVITVNTVEDITGDGTVDIDDLLAVIAAWGSCPKPPAACAADVNGDLDVNIDDLLGVISHWG